MVKAVSLLSLLGILLLTAFALHRSPAKSNPAPVASTTPVVVELFTSEGCSSCPPADNLVAQLEQEKTLDGISVIALSEHVDYWDGQGWKDRFSSHDFTERQNEYARALRIESPYTPQMVVDGRFELVGGDREALRQIVRRAADSPKAADVKLSWKSPGELHVEASNVSRPSAKVFLAITESGLSTTVDAGENGGRVLHHAGVVRLLRELGSPKDGRFSITAPVAVDPAWNKSKLKAVVMIQDGSNGPVLGAASQSF